MITKTMERAINDQINREYYSAFLYLSMAVRMEEMNFKGAANWLFKQYREELTHAEKFIEYLNEVGAHVELFAIEKPKSEWNSMLEAFKDAYNHEKFVTENIHKLVALANSENDYATLNMLQWFVKEQVEEEEQTLYIVNLLEMTGSHMHGVLQIDHKLGERGED